MAAWHNREHRPVEEETGLTHPTEHLQHVLARPHFEKPQRGVLTQSEREADLGGEPVNERYPHVEPILKPGELVGEMDVGGRDARPENRRRQRAPEDERGAGQLHQVCQVGVFHRNHATHGPERLGQSHRNHQPIVPAGVSEEVAPPVKAIPAETVGVVDIGVEIGVGVEEPGKLLGRCRIAVHREDPVGYQPHGAVPGLADPALQIPDVVMPDHFDIDAIRLEGRSGRQQRSMGLTVDQCQMILADHHGQCRQMSQGRGAGENHRSVEDLLESLAQLPVAGQRRVGDRGRV